MAPGLGYQIFAKRNVLLMIMIGFVMLFNFDADDLFRLHQSLTSGRVEEEVFQTQKMMQQLVDDARRSGKCEKPNPAATHVVCERLPFTKVLCGKDQGLSSAQDGEGRPFLVPNIVHLVYVGPKKYSMEKILEYLTVRAVASIQRPTAIYFHLSFAESEMPQTKLWRRMKREIPCLKFVKAKVPDNAFGHKFINAISSADFYRLLVLQQQGGMYIDMDAIMVNSINPIRIYPFTLGRLEDKRYGNGAIFSKPHAYFLERWLELYRDLDPKHFVNWGMKAPYAMYHKNVDYWQRHLHVEEFSLLRPSPYVDGINATTSDNFDISDKYFLHVHPRRCHRPYHKAILNSGEEELRVMDNVFGAAARMALFGSQDLVFLKGEIPHKRRPTKEIEKKLVW